jgi:DNA-binding GntR family transcriptional regulator
LRFRPRRSQRGVCSLVMTSQIEIAQRVVESILAQKLNPGDRLGEQELADVFGVSRTLVREAFMQLQARGFVEVRSRKGWYVVEPSIDQARDAFAGCASMSGTSGLPSTGSTRLRVPSCSPTSMSAWPNAWATERSPTCCAI